METKRLDQPEHIAAAEAMIKTMDELNVDKIALNEKMQAAFTEMSQTHASEMAALREEFSIPCEEMNDRQAAGYKRFMEDCGLTIGMGWQADFTYLDDHKLVFVYRDEEAAKAIN